MAVTYQDLLDEDIEECEIEQLVGEGWTLQKIWDEKVETVPHDVAYCGCDECGEARDAASDEDRCYRSVYR